jgi:molecular chaperone DnaK
MVDYSNIPRDSRRVPLETRVQFKFDRFDGFISEYSANISPGGMFIRTRVPQPPGTVLDFEFRLGDGFELIRGRGEVVWNRLEDEGPARPCGMGLHFLQLSEGSKELIYRIVDQHIAHGGTPFDVTQRPADPVPVPASPILPPPALASPVLAPPLSAATPWPRPAPSPPPASRDVFDLPAAASTPALGSDVSSWLPNLDEPRPGVSSPDEPFPEVLSSPEPAAEAPPMFAATFGHASVKQPRRVLPLVLLAAGLILAVGLFLLRDRLMGWVGLGGEEEIVAQATPPRRPKKAPRAQPVAPVPASTSDTTDLAAPGTVAIPPASPPAPAPVAAGATAAPAPAPATSGTPAPAAPPRPPVAPFPAVPEDSGPVLTAVNKITFEAAGGGTDVILWGNGAIPASVYTQTRIDGNPPRELFRLSGIRQPFAKPRLVVGTPELLQIRTGTHGGELHVVLDLAHPTVTVTQVEPGPHRLRIHLQRK